MISVVINTVILRTYPRQFQLSKKNMELETKKSVALYKKIKKNSCSNYPNQFKVRNWRINTQIGRILTTSQITKF